MEFSLAFSVLAQQISRVVEIDEQEMTKLKLYFALEQRPSGTVITRLGDKEKKIYFVSNGVLRAWFESDGEDKTAAFIYRGFWGSSFGSFLSGKESPYEIETLTDVSMLSMTKDCLENALQTCPAFSSYYRKLLEGLIVGMQFRERELMASTAKERFERFMSQSSFLLQWVPQKLWASYLNMTPETFSRLRRSWMNVS